MQVFLDHFGGILPRHSPQRLQVTQASIAHDVCLRNGRLEAWREKCAFAAVPSTTLSFHIHGCTPVAFSQLVQVAEIAPDWARAFITGRGDRAEVMDFSGEGEPSFHYLGVPAPENPVVASGTTACTRASDARSYVYTYVNKWGEESAPSPASNGITVDDGSLVELQGFARPPAGYAIEHINIYRAVTGFRAPNAQQQTPLTSFAYVDSIDITTSSYDDTINMLNLGPVLETEKVHTPPDGLRNIVSIEDTIRLAGCTTNRVYFTEPFEPYNWPVKYELTLDHNIVHMGAINKKVFVTTDSVPYIIDASDCSSERCLTVQRTNTPLPDIACSHAHSAITSQYGFIYVTPLGIVLLKANATYEILTAQWYDSREWSYVAPETARLGLYQNYLFCTTDRVSFVIALDLNTFGDIPGGEMSTLTDKPIDLVQSNTGDLFMLEHDTIYVWNKGLQYRPFYWESRELLGAAKNSTRGISWSPASAKVKSDDVKFTLITPLLKEAYTRKVLGEDFFRLPRVGRNLWYKIRLEGIQPVLFAALGTSNFTLNDGT